MFRIPAVPAVFHHHPGLLVALMWALTVLGPLCISLGGYYGGLARLRSLESRKRAAA